MKIKRNLIIKLISSLILLTSCSVINQLKMKKYKEYTDLNLHQGTENYEVVKLFDINFTVKEKLIETKQRLLSTSAVDEKERKSKRLKVDFFGNIIGENQACKTIEDGTMWNKNLYFNWLLNGDIKEHYYIDPFTNKEIKSKFQQPEKKYKKWLVKFEELYGQATVVYISNSYYYLKINDKWFKMDAFFEKSLNNFQTIYPKKINQEEKRIVDFQKEVSDDIMGKQLQTIEYIEMDSESDGFLNPISFSSGYYLFELKLPKGDVLKFKRYGAVGFNADMNIYQIPKKLGGSDEVFFIEQIPRDSYPKKSFGGFYVIRPKNYKKMSEYQFYLNKELKL